MSPLTAFAAPARRLAVLACLLLAGPAARAEEEWFVFSIGDAPVGYTVESRSDEGGDRRTESTLEASLNRLGTRVEMRFATSSLERAGGELASVRSDVRLSQQTVRVEAQVEGERIRILSSSSPDAPPHERWIERGEETLLGPAAIRRLGADRLRSAGDVVEFALFSPELQRVVKVRRKVTATDAAAPCLPNGPATRRVEETTTGMPAVRTLWLEADGDLIQDSIDSPFGVMTTCRASREAALAVAGGGTLPEEMYRRTIVRSNLRLRDPAAVDRMLLRVHSREADSPLPELASEHQSVRADPGGALLVEVRRPAFPGTAGDEPGGSEKGTVTAASPPSEYLTANALVESDRPEIVDLARQLVGDERDPWRAAQRLTAWVAQNMTLDLGVVMAPASELVRDRRGTCVGYATLLATLARAAGIPSRVAMGMVYYGGIWGGHAWTEVWVGGRWLPIDSAVYAPGVASAARLSAGSSSLLDGGGDLTARLGQLFGNVDVAIIELDAGEGAVTVGADAPAYEASGGRYRNPGIGLEVDADGWSVEQADSLWPSTLLVAFRRGEERVELHELPRWPPARAAAVTAEWTAAGRALHAVPAGGTLWVFSAGGPRPADSLRDLLAAVRKGP